MAPRARARDRGASDFRRAQDQRLEKQPEIFSSETAVTAMQETDQEHDTASGPAVSSRTSQGDRASLAAARRGLGDQLQAAVVEIRPKQWSKNGLVLLALVFSRHLTDLPA